MEATFQALLQTVDDNPMVKISPCDILKKVTKTEKWPKDLQNYKQMTRAPSTKTTSKMTHLFKHCITLLPFPSSYKEAKMMLPKPCMDPKLLQYLHLISLLSTTGKQFEKVIQKIVQGYIDERNALKASQAGFQACHSMTLQCMRLTNGVTLHLKK